MIRLALLAFTVVSAMACGARSIGTGAVGQGSALIPPMPPHVSSFQKWEHLCFGGFDQLEDASARIAEAGQQGWEMVGVAQSIMCFKRPAPPPAPRAPTPAR
ncbi:MAG TPA: hypothetical protein VKB80_00765 [Kofleriaceae bacterium]|nr:hypothetical protein [Kofleriaceae bacterium]